MASRLLKVGDVVRAKDAWQPFPIDQMIIKHFDVCDKQQIFHDLRCQSCLQAKLDFVGYGGGFCSPCFELINNTKRRHKVHIGRSSNLRLPDNGEFQELIGR